jgi:arylsulfatase
VAHSISVHANVPKGGAEGVLLSMGSVDGSFVFYVQKSKLTYGYNYVADQCFKVQSETAIPEGDHIFSFEFTPTGKANIPKGKAYPQASSYSSMAIRLAAAICLSPYPCR